MEPWRKLDDASASEAARLLGTCCGAKRWIARMVERRPFNDRDTLLRAARDEWFALGEADWLEAFSRHPRIGDRADLARRFPATAHLSAREQAGIASADGDVLDRLARGNRDYESRFGFIFIVCASGRGADEMLTLLESRLANDRDRELRTAAEEQARITELRLLSLS